jgi:hypothetical protein
MKLTLTTLIASALLAAHASAADPLPSWNDTAPKQAITSFVEEVTKEGSADFVPVPERIAVFDNDGCLWAEQPMYFQAFFIFDRIRELAPQHPEWKEKEPHGRTTQRYPKDRWLSQPAELSDHDPHHRARFPYELRNRVGPNSPRLW